MARTRTKPAEFDESTPPPRQRPRGNPAPYFTALPPGEEAGPTFVTWDREGRIPEGSVLCRFHGTADRTLGSDGAYEVAVYPPHDKPWLGALGKSVAAARLEPLRIAAVLVERLRSGARVYAVLSPVSPAGVAG